jgi:hypothetical protein
VHGEITRSSHRYLRRESETFFVCGQVFWLTINPGRSQRVPAAKAHGERVARPSGIPAPSFFFDGTG